MMKQHNVIGAVAIIHIILHVYLAECASMLLEDNGTSSAASNWMASETSTGSWCPQGYQLGNSSLDVCNLMSCLSFKKGLMVIRDSVPASTVQQRRGGGGLDGSLLVCQKPTQRFSQCPKTIVGAGHFKVSGNDSVIWVLQRDSFVQVRLGEFVFLSSVQVLVCADSGIVGKLSTVSYSLSCMPLRLPSSACKLMPTGDLYLINAKLRIPSGFYMLDHNEYNVCYGMSSEFTSCSPRGMISSIFTVTLPDMTLYTNLSIVQTYALGSYLWTKDRSDAVVCIDSSDLRPVTKTEKYLIGVSMVISSVFLVFTLLIHLIFPSLNYHAKPLLCHIISLFVMYISTTIRFFHTMYNTTEVECYTLFTLAYVSTLGAFFWLSVIAFDLWRVFTNLRPTTSPGSTRGKKRKFLAQCLYAWGIPVVMCAVALVITKNPKIQDALNLPFPLLNYCWFVTNKGMLVFLYAPIMIILIENAAFFTLTVINLHKASRDADILNKKVSRQLFKIFGKLFVVMGLFWFAEFLSWAFQAEASDWSYPTDLINSLEGVAIFFIYVFKKKTLRVIRERFGYADSSTSSFRRGGRACSTSNVTSLHGIRDPYRKTEVTLSVLSPISTPPAVIHRPAAATTGSQLATARTTTSMEMARDSQ